MVAWFNAKLMTSGVGVNLFISNSVFTFIDEKDAD